VLVELLDRARSNAPRLDQLLNARVSHADECEFRRNEEGICGNQQHHQEDL
jgi:hypothetical protein